MKERVLRRDPAQIPGSAGTVFMLAGFLMLWHQSFLTVDEQIRSNRWQGCLHLGKAYAVKKQGFLFRGLCLLRITAGQPGEGARWFHFNLPFALWLLPARCNAWAVLLHRTVLVSTASSLKLLVNSICLASLWFFPCFQPRLVGRIWKLRYSIHFHSCHLPSKGEGMKVWGVNWPAQERTLVPSGAGWRQVYPPGPTWSGMGAG